LFAAEITEDTVESRACFGPRPLFAYAAFPVAHAGASEAPSCPMRCQPPPFPKKRPPDGGLDRVSSWSFPQAITSSQASQVPEPASVPVRVPAQVPVGAEELPPGPEQVSEARASSRSR